MKKRSKKRTMVLAGILILLVPVAIRADLIEPLVPAWEYVGGVLTLSGSVSTGPLVVNQNDDDNGIQGNGYDDESAYNYKIYVDSSGRMRLVADKSIFFLPGEGGYFYSTGGDPFKFQNTGTGDLEFAEGGGDILFYDSAIWVPSDDTSLAAADSITVANGIVRVVGNGGAVTLTSTPHIVDAEDGKTVIIQGTHDTNTVTFQDESNLADSGMQLAGGADCTLGAGDTLMLIYDAGDDNWYEVSRADN